MTYKVLVLINKIFIKIINQMFCFLHLPMMDWSSSLDSGANSVVMGYRWHAVEVRVKVRVKSG